ncbi:hypothetical protein ISS30_08040 [bacterium]|nr:hypothetical protein [bacterium]
MKQLLLIPLALSMLFFSCGERENPAVPQAGYEIVAQLAPVGIYRGIFVNGANSFIAADYMKILKVDLSDPASPFITGYIDDDRIGTCGSVYYSNETGRIVIESVFAPEHLAGFSIIQDSLMNDSLKKDFFALSPPLQKFTFKEFTHWENDTTLVTDLIYIYAADLGETWKFTEQHLQYFSFLNSYEYIGSKDYSAHKVYDFALKDSLAFLAVNEYGLDIVDLNSGDYLTAIGSYDTEGFCRGVAVQGDYCYLADRHWGLQILDISNPAQPDSVANLKFTGADDCVKVKVLGDRAVVLDSYDGVFAVDISNPADPKLLFNFDTITPVDVVIDDEYIYVVDEDAGLIIARW